MKKQTTRMIKLVCDECQWACRTTRIHIEPHLSCPVHACIGELKS